jgi:hypothetical protein
MLNKSKVFRHFLPDRRPAEQAGIDARRCVYLHLDLERLLHPVAISGGRQQIHLRYRVAEFCSRVAGQRIRHAVEFADGRQYRRDGTNRDAVFRGPTLLCRRDQPDGGKTMTRCSLQ